VIYRPANDCVISEGMSKANEFSLKSEQVSEELGICICVHRNIGCRFRHSSQTPRKKARLIMMFDQGKGRAFKRPAPAVWGNGLWGSVGGAGRSYD
jgi:hypothetical protein